MSDPYDRDKPMTFFDRLRLGVAAGEDIDAIIDEIEEVHESMQHENGALKALLNGQIAGDDIPIPTRPGDPFPPGVALVLNLLADLVDSVPEAENYVQLAWTDSVKGRGYELTVRYAEGEMPATRADRLEKERDDARRDLARIFTVVSSDDAPRDKDLPNNADALWPLALNAVKAYCMHAEEREARLSASPLWHAGDPECELGESGTSFCVLVFDPDEETFHIVQHDEDVPGYYLDHSMTQMAWVDRWIWAALPQMEVSDVE